MEVVQDRTAATLLPIIQAHVWPGTTVSSDEWIAYCWNQRLLNVQQDETINLSLHFVDPTTGVYTQNVESYLYKCLSQVQVYVGSGWTTTNSLSTLTNLCGKSAIEQQPRMPLITSAQNAFDNIIDHTLLTSTQFDMMAIPLLVRCWSQQSTQTWSFPVLVFWRFRGCLCIAFLGKFHVPFIVLFMLHDILAFCNYSSLL